MYQLCLILLVLFCSSLYGDRIGSVEFQLPNHGQGWDTANHIEKGHALATIIYKPEDPNSKELFAAQMNKLPLGDLDIKNFKCSLESIYIGSDIMVSVVHSDAQSTLYAWSALNENNENNYGWTRVMRNPPETVILQYHTQEKEKAENARGPWLHALREAKFIRACS